MYREHGWRGGTDVPEDAEENLPTEDRVVARIAGKIAEELFGTPSYQSAWWGDMETIFNVLSEAGFSDDEHSAEITKAKHRAKEVLDRHQDKAHALAAMLVGNGRVERLEFLKLMGK